MNQSKINICGIGPGNPQYVLPIIHTVVAESDIIIGGKRHISLFTDYNKQSFEFTGNTSILKDIITRNNRLNISILVSGDTGFYSLRSFIANNFPTVNITVYPGISSYQYFYAKLNMGYEHALLTSLHGRSGNFITHIYKYSSVFILTDKVNTPAKIAKTLTDNNYHNTIMHIGLNLSYSDEQIISDVPSTFLASEFNLNLCSVIIENREFNKIRI